MPSQLILEHCSIESSDQLTLMPDARFSVNGESPHAACAYGPFNPKGRGLIEDRLTDCELKETNDGGYIVTGTSVGLIRKLGVSPAEAKITLKVTPGRFKGATAAKQFAEPAE